MLEQVVLSAQVKGPGVDKAFEYLKKHEKDAPESSASLKSIRRKVDHRLVPLLFFTYFFQFLDKVAYNYASVMGMRQDLNLTGNDYSNAATFTYVAYIAAEILSVFALQKLPAARWLGMNAIVWGIACAATAAAHNYSTLLVARLFLGFAEAAVGPCLIAINSQWYKKDEQTSRFNLLYLGLGIGQICGGLMSYGFQEVEPGEAALAGWRIMFLVFGGATILLGLCLMVFIPSSPMHARWLSDTEKTKFLNHLSVNRTGIENYAFSARQILEALTDPSVILLMLNVVVSSTSAGIGTTYSATLVGLLGFAPRRAALLNTPGGAVMFISTLLVGILLRYRVVNRGTASCMVTAVGLIGSCLLAFVPSPTPLRPDQHKDNLPALLAGLYIVNFQVPVLAIQYSWAAANTAGATKKAIVYSLVSACFAAGSIIGLQSFQARDVPSGYQPAKETVVGTQAASIALALLLMAYYRWQNKKKDAASLDSNETSSEASAWKGMSDKEDTLFRYSY